MKILQLETGLYPDAQAIHCALRSEGAPIQVDTIDIRPALEHPKFDDPLWDRVIAAVLDCDLTITV